MKTQYVILVLIASAATALALDPPPGGGYPFQTTALGDEALLNYVPAGLGGNTALGFQALKNDTSGYLNTAVGEYALLNNTIGLWNVAVGANTLTLNSSGTGNIGIGIECMVANTTGSYNTAVGSSALHGNQQANGNTAVGYSSLASNTGADNTALGILALSKKEAGDENIAIGINAGSNLNSGSNNIDIGNGGAKTESKVIRIGTGKSHKSTYIAGISGVTVAGGVGVIVDSGGHLGTVTSSARSKENIKPMAQSSETLLSLKPVTFRYKKELDPAGIPQFGLVAEQVEEVNPDLVARDEQGKPYTVRYEAVNAMLLNEFLKEHQTVKAQSATIQDLKSALAQQQAQIKALSEGLQKVSAQMQSKQDAPRLVSAGD